MTKLASIVLVAISVLSSAVPDGGDFTISIDRMATEPKIILCVALVLGGGLSASVSAVTDSAAHASGGVELTNLVSFDGTNGTWPQAGLVLGTDGNFYGTTYYGGASTGQGNRGLGLQWREK